MFGINPPSSFTAEPTLGSVNHTSRPYYAIAGQSSGGLNLRYIEVTNAQHFDAFLSLPGYDIRYVPYMSISIKRSIGCTNI
ncbi:MAG: hypothetical protein IPL51_13115 [Candidatus Competibacteraceae bacterium]|nr:hypothetical protein [Candidatus Competibacteraceae bacterium]